jgi:hypothetical protein
VDATLGAGGHAEALLASGPQVRLLGVDRDPNALELARGRLASFGDRVSFVQADFGDLEGVLAGRPDPDLPDALRNFAKRIPVIDARFFVTAVLTQREAGGNLAEVLDNLGAVIRERFKVKRQVQVLSAHGRITGWVLGMLPPALAVATFIINPHHLGGLLNDPLGQRMIMAAIVLQILGVLTIRKLVDIEY